MSTIAVIGLGSMGYGMARSILKAGHRTLGSDVNPDSVKRFVVDGGEALLPAESAETVAELDALVVVVLNATQTESVLFGDDGLVPKLRPGAVVIACATMPPAVARDFEARCLERGVHYLDAPISGGSVKAASGQLSIMASGSEASFSAARDALDAMSETVFELGSAAGAGAAMKSVNQMLAGVHIAAMAEAMTFGMTQGIAPEAFMKVIPHCAGTSWMLENRGPHIVSGNYSPHSAVNIWLKDLGIVLDVAREARFSAPLTASALQQFVAAAGQGLGHEDDAAVAKVYAGNAGLDLPETQT